MCICKGLNKGLLGDSKNKECCSKWCVNKAKGARGIGYKRNWKVWAVKISKTQIKVKWMARELRVGHQGMVIPTWNPAVWKQSALDKSLSQFPLYRCCCCFVVVKKKKKKKCSEAEKIASDSFLNSPLYSVVAVISLFTIGLLPIVTNTEVPKSGSILSHKKPFKRAA